MLKHLLRYFAVLFVALCFLACAAFRPVLRDVTREAAELLCAQAYSDKLGITAEDARRIYCSVEPVLRPFLAAAREARTKAEPESFGVGLANSDAK